MANTFTLQGTSSDSQNNAAYVGRYMILRVTSVGTDTEDAASYPQKSVSFLIGSDGTWTSDSTLWVNGDSGIESFYEMLEPSGQRIKLVFPSAVAGTTVRYEFALENYLASAAASQLSPALGAHLADQTNPHVVTKAQLSLDTTDDVTFANITVGGDIIAGSAGLDIKNGVGAVAATVGASNSKDLDVQGALTLGTDLAITEGGTGASTAATARTALGFQSNAGAATTSVVATTYTTLAADKYILANNAAGVAVTLLAAATAGDGFELTIKRVGATGAITIDGNASETIDGGLTATLTSQYESITIVSDGSNWHIK